MLSRDFCKICYRKCEDPDWCLKGPKLNLGSGLMILGSHINFDTVMITRPNGKTDVLGWIENVVPIFGENVFEEILCAHVIEHFYPQDAMNVLKDCLKILRPGGKLIVEAGCIQGQIEMYVAKHPWFINNGGIKQFIMSIFGQDKHAWKELGWHHWGYTGDTMAEVMESCGYKIVHKGIGRTHGMGKRDFRVEGIK